jgi:hypothetical protein
VFIRITATKCGDGALGASRSASVEMREAATVRDVLMAAYDAERDPFRMRALRAIAELLEAK